jgi:hypothetical protein
LITAHDAPNSASRTKTKQQRTALATESAQKKPAVAKKSYRGISRIDTKNTHGWLMRLSHARKTYSKLFSDGVYGGAKKSLKAAQKYQKKLAKELDAPLPSEKKRTGPPRRVAVNKGTTGMAGVYRGSSTNRSGTMRAYFSVSWNPEPGVTKSTSFSVNKYGEKEAFRLACELRQKMVKKILGYVPENEASAHQYVSADSVFEEKKEKKKKKD